MGQFIFMEKIQKTGKKRILSFQKWLNGKHATTQLLPFLVAHDVGIIALYFLRSKKNVYLVFTKSTNF
jgi:hypothetical protein